MFEKKSEDGMMSLAKSKSPLRKEKEPNLKKFGHLLGIGGNLGDTFLTATVGNPMVEGQTGAGLSATN